MMIKSKNSKSVRSTLSLETRIVATFALMEMVNTHPQRISEQDLNEIFDKIKNFENNTTEFSSSILQNDNSKLNEMNKVLALRTRIYRHRITNIYNQLGYFGLCKGDTQEHKLSSIEILATTMYEAGIKNADMIAQKLVNKELTEKEAEVLQSNLIQKYDNFKKSLTQDFRTYKNLNRKNSYIEIIRQDIEEYIFDKNAKLEIKYSIRDEQKNFRHALREKCAGGSKPQFLKLIGTMLAEGRNLAKNSIMPSNYSEFCKLVTLGMNSDKQDQIINNALFLTGQNIPENDKKKAYQEKCKELYFKMVAGILSQKYEYNKKHNLQTDYAIFLQAIDNKYIKSLCEGNNNIDLLAFQEPDYKRRFDKIADELQLRKDLRDETTEKQYLTLHHSEISIGAAYDVCNKIAPNLDEELKLDKCDKITNNIGNHMLVIGQKLHQSLEARGIIAISAHPNCSIFAAEIDCQALADIARNLPSYMNQGFNHCLKIKENERKKLISVNLKLPESEEITFIRQSLNKKVQHVSALQKFTRYERGM